MTKITERGMIFNGEMVRAILDGRKTQTRRPYSWKRQPAMEMAERDDGSLWPWAEDCENGGDIWIQCPFGEVGDRIWVRETWARYNIDQDSHDMAYRATTPEDWPKEGRWRPSIHMPRWASRILLEITDVRVERLNSISEEDARAEGCCGGHDSIPGYMYSATPHEHFHHVWTSIYGDDSWKVNPWVWVIEFKRIEGEDHATD